MAPYALLGDTSLLQLRLEAERQATMLPRRDVSFCFLGRRSPRKSVHGSLLQPPAGGAPDPEGRGRDKRPRRPQALHLGASRTEGEPPPHIPHVPPSALLPGGRLLPRPAQAAAGSATTASPSFGLYVQWRGVTARRSGSSSERLGSLVGAARRRDGGQPRGGG